MPTLIFTSSFYRNLRMHGLNCHLLSCKFSGVPGSLTQWSPGPLAFTHRHGQSDGVHWPYLLCIRGRKTLSLVRFSGFWLFCAANDWMNGWFIKKQLMGNLSSDYMNVEWRNDHNSAFGKFKQWLTSVSFLNTVQSTFYVSISVDYAV